MSFTAFSTDASSTGSSFGIGGCSGSSGTAMWAALEHKDGRARLPTISNYLEERRRLWHRWIGALTRLDLPTLVLWGLDDPIAVAAIAEQLAREIPGAQLRTLPGLGHFPMLERPGDWGGPLRGFLGERVAKGAPRNSR